MSAPPYMPLYVADYLGDTRHLSTEQHGAYLLILMAMWRAGGRLPNEAVKLARIASLTPARWAKLEVDVLGLFDVIGDEIGHKRIQKEFEKYTRTSANRRVSGALGGKAKALKNKEVDTATATTVPDQKAAISEPEPELEIEDPPISPSGEIAPQVAKPKRRAAKRCPADWEPNDGHRELVVKLDLGTAAARQALEMFRDHEFKKAISDWDAAFRNWLRREQPKRNPSHDRGSPDLANRKLEQRIAEFRPMAGGAEEALNRRGRRWGSS